MQGLVIENIQNNIYMTLSKHFSEEIKELFE